MVSVGNTPSDFTVADLSRDSLPDIVVSDQASGDVTGLLDDRTHSFSQQLRFNAGTEPSTLESSPGSLYRTRTLPASVVAGDFFGNGKTDLVVDRGSHDFKVLPTDGHGGSLDPSSALTTSTSDSLNTNNQPGATVVRDFNRDGRLDLAVLMEDTGQVSICSGVGNGTFRHTFSIAVGDQATGSPSSQETVRNYGIFWWAIALATF